MASNVFGSPITNLTLQGMPEYIGKNITRLDRAKVALNMKNAQEKDINARHYIEAVKARWGYGVSTLCLIYNATGDPLKLVQSHNWYGHIGPAPCPAMVENGQWGAFLHVKRSGTASGSSAAVVYRGKNADGDLCDWMLSWSNPWNRNHWDNSVYSDETDNWGYISNMLYNSGLQHSDEWNGCVSTG
ncbi:hypothetical protein LguiB_015208 [Lonicera macranthoides]